MSERLTFISPSNEPSARRHWSKRLSGLRHIKEEGMCGMGFYFREGSARDAQWLAWYDTAESPEPPIPIKEREVIVNLCKARYPWLNES